MTDETLTFSAPLVAFVREVAGREEERMSKPYKRGDVVYATRDIDDVPGGARGVVVDAYGRKYQRLVVAFRWCNNTLRRVPFDYVEGEKFLELGAYDVCRKAPPLPSWARP